jgi:hypothetical protein
MDHHLSQRKDVSSRVTYSYVLCGWHTDSDVPLSGLPTSVWGCKHANVLIRIATGDSPISKSDSSSLRLFEHSNELSLIGIADVADFEVCRGRQISIWPADGARQKDVELFLFGPVWATLCHQRGILPLHASAIVTKNGIAAFAGHSGAGKSTTAALMGSSGYALLADDIVPVSFRKQSLPGAWPFLRRLKLQLDPIIQLALPSTELVSETFDNRKYFVNPKIAAGDEWIRLERIYLLEIDEATSGVSIDRITGPEAVRVIIDQTYHFQFIIRSGRFRDHLISCTRLASQVAVYRLCRPPDFDIGELRFLLRAHLEDQPA